MIISECSIGIETIEEGQQALPLIIHDDTSPMGIIAIEEDQQFSCHIDNAQVHSI